MTNNDADELFGILATLDDAQVDDLVHDLKWCDAQPAGVHLVAVGPWKGTQLPKLCQWLTEQVGFSRGQARFSFPADVREFIDTYIALRLSP